MLQRILNDNVLQLQHVEAWWSEDTDEEYKMYIKHMVALSNWCE